MEVHATYAMARHMASYTHHRPTTLGPVQRSVLHLPQAHDGRERMTMMPKERMQEMFRLGHLRA